MTIDAVLEGVTLVSKTPDLSSRLVTSLAYDSRKVELGSLFFAFQGAKVDGRKFASEAMGAGAVAIVSDTPPPEGASDLHHTWIQVDDSRKALALAAGNFYHHPDHRLKITGITGTNGKTTTSYLIDSIYRTAGFTTAMIGTIEYRLAGKTLPAINTTPESLELFRIFSELEGAGGTHVVMEASSHALAAGRVHGVKFETAVFTNLTRDHLDYHESMEAYFAAKGKLFSPSIGAPPTSVVINRDDAFGRKLPVRPDSKTLWYGLEPGADVRAEKVKSGFEGLRFNVLFEGKTYPVQSFMIGDVNVQNILAAWCAAYSNGVDPTMIAEGIKACEAVPGRFERVSEGQPFLVVVDYAHTDDALRNTLATARNLTSRRVITVFGCGGDRDRNKRPLMGSAAAAGSDLVVLTSDNPRSEDPISIMTDALVGVRRHDTPYLAEIDREKAIRAAIREAAPGDVVIIAGKGHENYQVLADRTIPFDDRDVARSVLRAFGYRKEIA